MPTFIQLTHRSIVSYLEKLLELSLRVGTLWTGPRSMEVSFIPSSLPKSKAYKKEHLIGEEFLSQANKMTEVKKFLGLS